MTTFQKIACVLVGAVIAVGVYGGYVQLFGGNGQTAVGTSAQGTTFGTAKFAGVAANLSAPGANATSSSILNTDANDRYITSIKVGCEGVGTSQTAFTGAGLSALTLSVATSSTAAPATNGNANVVGGGAITISTSTAQFAISSSTSPTGNSKVYFIWAAGSYLTFTTNATNTALCTFGSEYIPS